MSIKKLHWNTNTSLFICLYIIYDFHALAKLSRTPRLLSYKAFYKKHLLTSE